MFKTRKYYIIFLKKYLVAYALYTTIDSEQLLKHICTIGSLTSQNKDQVKQERKAKKHLTKRDT
jgi:cobalamin biosynthesis protein CobD/CbiB